MTQNYNTNNTLFESPRNTQTESKWKKKKGFEDLSDVIQTKNLT